MKKILLVSSIFLVLTACDQSSLFSEPLTSIQKSCRSESAEVAFQILATVDPELTRQTGDKFNLSTTLANYKEKGCSPKFVKNALNGMTNRSWYEKLTQADL